MSLATIGLLWNRPWVIAFPTRLLTGDWPSWTTHLYWYILFGGILLVFNRTGKNAYCPWICPFGAAQDVIGLVGGARRRRVPNALLFTWVKRVLLWLAVLLGLLHRAPGAVSYEVFAALFRLSGTGFQFAILAIVLDDAPCREPAVLQLGLPRGHDRADRPLRPRARAPSPGPRGRAASSAPADPPRRPIPSRAPHGPGLPPLAQRVLTAAGLLCALLVLGHLHERLSAAGQGRPGGPARPDVRHGRRPATAGSTSETGADPAGPPPTHADRTGRSI